MLQHLMTQINTPWAATCRLSSGPHKALGNKLGVQTERGHSHAQPKTQHPSSPRAAPLSVRLGFHFASAAEHHLCLVSLSISKCANYFVPARIAFSLEALMSRLALHRPEEAECPALSSAGAVSAHCGSSILCLRIRAARDLTRRGCSVVQHARLPSVARHHHPTDSRTRMHPPNVPGTRTWLWFYSTRFPTSKNQQGGAVAGLRAMPCCESKTRRNMVEHLRRSLSSCMLWGPRHRCPQGHCPSAWLVWLIQDAACYSSLWVMQQSVSESPAADVGETSVSLSTATKLILCCLQFSP